MAWRRACVRATRCQENQTCTPQALALKPSGATPTTRQSRRSLRTSTGEAMAVGWDLLLVALAALHGVAVVAVPAAPVIAVGIWWNANTIAHNFIHRPF